MMQDFRTGKEAQNCSLNVRSVSYSASKKMPAVIHTIVLQSRSTFKAVQSVQYSLSSEARLGLTCILREFLFAGLHDLPLNLFAQSAVTRRTTVRYLYIHYFEAQIETFLEAYARSFIVFMVLILMFCLLPITSMTGVPRML